eukprot:scaffold1449_cov244-Pinguiococcus_pyrenoidosus.AAC.9
MDNGARIGVIVLMLFVQCKFVYWHVYTYVQRRRPLCGRLSPGIPSDLLAALGSLPLSVLPADLSYIWFCISQIPFMARIQKDYCRRFCGCDKCPGFFE